MSNNQNPEIIKIVIIGQSSVGKTSIISQFVEKTFQQELQSTVGGTFNSKSVKCEDLNKTLKLEIWDTAGQERYRSVTKMFYKDADVALLVYDITNLSSFEDLQTYWVQQVLECSLKKTMLIIVANKSDLIENEQVDEEGNSTNLTVTATGAVNAYSTSMNFSTSSNDFDSITSSTIPVDEISLVAKYYGTEYVNFKTFKIRAF